VKKRDYNVIAGESHAVEAHTSTVVTSQPAGQSGTENYVLDLDAQQVATWTPEDVINFFVEKVGLGYLNEAFLANKITGRALMLLTEDHLKEMGVHAIGDRVYLIDMIGLLKKKKKELETSATLWSGETPATGFAYSKGCCHGIGRILCPCCITRTYWKVTAQGVFYREVPPFRKHFGTVSTEYMDFRFFKDLELKENFFFCCCCKRHALEMYVEDKDSKASERDPSAGAFTAPHILLHPEAAKVERIVRNAWAQARLVAD